MALLFGSCDMVLKNSQVLSEQPPRTITYADYRIDIDSQSRTIHTDTDDIPLNGEFYITHDRDTLESFYLEDGLIEGPHFIYTKEGVMRSEEHYTAGIKNGMSYTYFDNGTVQNEAEYKNGKLMGQEVEYSPVGEKISTREFDDKGVEYNSYYRDNKLFSSQYKKNIDGGIYDLLVFYDEFEKIILVMGKRDYDEDSPMIYVFDENFELIEGFNSEKDQVKAAHYLGILRSLQ